MSKKQSSKDIMLAHSAAKVNFYQSYLERYLSVMSVTQYFDTINIFDVFCGRGEYDDGGLGSPIRAVQTIMKIKQDKPSDLKINLFLNDAEKEYVERVKKYIEEHFPDYNKYCNIKNFLKGTLITVNKAPLSKKYFSLYPLNHVESPLQILPIFFLLEYSFNLFFKQSVINKESSPPLLYFALGPNIVLNLIFLSSTDFLLKAILYDA